MADKRPKPLTGPPRRSKRQVPPKTEPKDETPTCSVANGKSKSSAEASARAGTKVITKITPPFSTSADSNRKNEGARNQRIAKLNTKTPAANGNKRKKNGITQSGSKSDKETFSSPLFNGKKRKITRDRDFRVSDDSNTKRNTSGSLVAPSTCSSSGRTMPGPSPLESSSESSTDGDSEGSEASDYQNPQDSYLLAVPPMYPVRTEIWYPTFPPWMRNMIFEACQIAFALRNGSHTGRVEDVLADFADRELAHQVVIEIARQQRELPPTAWEMQTLYPAWSWVGPGYVQHPGFMPVNFIPDPGLQPGGINNHQNDGISLGVVDAKAVVPDAGPAIEAQQNEHSPGPVQLVDDNASGAVKAGGGRSSLVAGVNCPPNVLQLANLNTYPHPRPVGMSSTAEHFHHGPGLDNLASTFTSIADASCMTSTGVAEASFNANSGHAEPSDAATVTAVAENSVSMVASLPKRLGIPATIPWCNSAGTTNDNASRSPGNARFVPAVSPSNPGSWRKSLNTQTQSPTVPSDSSSSAENFQNLSSSNTCANATCKRPWEIICGRCLETCYCSRRCQLGHLKAHMHKCQPASDALCSRIEALRGDANEQASVDDVVENPEKCTNSQCPSVSTEHPVRCIRCQDAQYCSITCQVFNWPEHMEMCMLHVDTNAADAFRITALEKWANASYTRIAQYLSGKATFDDPKNLGEVMEQIERAGAQFSTMKVKERIPSTESDEK